MIIPVILSGGAGTRLWPLSRELYPKQLLPLAGEHTMLQETALRLEGLSALGAPLVVCNEAHRFMVAEQMRRIGRTPAAILLEPLGRNTAPAVAVAALQALDGGEDPLLLVLPADHVIAQPEALRAAIESGAPLAREGRLMTFGIVPTAPETGYGYIRADRACPLSFVTGHLLKGKDQGTGMEDATAFAVAQFVEKPDSATAQRYLDSGEYFWNSGMFLFKASRYLEELERLAPAMLRWCRAALEQAVRDLDFIRLDAEAFAACPGNSIDYAVMEKTDAAAVIPLAAGWNDVGSWSALWEIGARDADGNVRRGDVLTSGTRNCYLHAERRLIAAVGLEDHIVVETADAVLVAHRDRVQEVKDIVAQLKAQGREEALLHRRVNRPWGSYEGLVQDGRFQVKRISVNPGASLSRQLHHHRAEHWVVVRGTARVTRGEETFILAENESTFIPLGTEHRLENPGKIPLEMIEVQSGSYLGEDDIVRFEDQYGR
ncbi:mannose-1-phosphate guanylyltransferase/mannose-6-phosphate isomerase [Geoalkalibacter halelectricus]|uniref:mannose-1-phosphate guanylyltransferase n=1 Tax=Geoalkalibacter halelectricus TaxID=2847045 RepID=A0ABY5ZHQ8_9BACT|nr:mannose-1-phosphate guanylyltransferase/mannose-6-phosphate isomerase [Geoalkalibacter halelectricus]MDO3377805.1 mannose-1-phosphate guanylyltransferase/mannose-6-phosphate isomerase [Geoalkalibacter halelectricus]UWZ78603.1 mannose-1-phosphate guanylyltransferase/mannose-6-phosphate isomerase [Geoalkalibacter halelectricus]